MEGILHQYARNDEVEGLYPISDQPELYRERDGKLRPTRRTRVQYILETKTQPQPPFDDRAHIARHYVRLIEELQPGVHNVDVDFSDESLHELFDRAVILIHRLLP